MDEQDFKNLINDLPSEQQKKAILLYNGHVKAANEYQKESTSANLRDWKASEEALNDFIKAIQPSNNDKPAFKNRIEVLKYLKNQGARVGKSKLYNDSESGKLRMQPDGSVLLSDVDIYIRAYLSPAKKGGAIADIDILQKEKLEQEIKKLKEQNKDLEWKREKESGKYILRDDFEMEIVARAAVIDVSLKQMVNIKALDWVSITQGKHRLVKNMTDAIIREIESVLNDYANTDKFQILIDK